ncbi:hypothetical protein Acr_00g0022610 [Actinidia rufa]|uniref:TF-B3 domain-containing protein n=1 Tax=Actinidia rufa TaxID=165716 RepID=A0A7J0DCL0_9ERIC|nr:hypothetical protein Acr_00g0022610 [Actinidia rufa]
MQKYRHYQEQENSNRCHYCKELCNDTKKGSLISLPGREKLFNKVVTRSDIKQYRLAIPKHQAKKHFPPHVVSSSSNSPFLCMEDNEGKVWRFKYSFWKSSQGYMLTNEWNQFVKEKRVSVGDMVSFFRSNGADKRLFIDWKPQNPSGIVANSEPLESTQNGQTVMLFGVNISTN